jgi:transcriptional regulator with XRE-family HTH domain
MQPNYRLKSAIYATGKRQGEVAHECGIPELEMTKIVTGRKNPDDDTRNKIAHILGLPVEDLFDHPPCCPSQN